MAFWGGNKTKKMIFLPILSSGNNHLTNKLFEIKIKVGSKKSRH